MIRRAIVLAFPAREGDPMISRIPGFLHPVAGKSVLWHVTKTLRGLPNPPDVQIWLPGELEGSVPEDLADSIEVVLWSREDLPDLPSEEVAVVVANSFLSDAGAKALVSGHGSGWIGSGLDDVAGCRIAAGDADGIRSSLERGRLPADGDQKEAHSFVIADRADLARAHGEIRDLLVAGLMDAGVTFVIPDSVVVDADVRIGRDTIIYPGVVLEGQTMVGEETVIGPGCRIIDSWIGSGVEMKGWNYISHASIRNRAILEPYVRRGYD